MTAAELPPPRTVGPLTRTDIVRYQGASGDFNPIHHDEPFAASVGFPAPLSVGMLQAGALAAYAAEWWGEENVRRYRARFSEQVWPGDTLTLAAVRARAVPQEPLIEVELECRRDGGGVAIRAWATFAAPDTEGAGS